MGSQRRSSLLLVSCWVAIWITYLVMSCSALPKPQANSEDDDYYANFAATKGAPLITPVSPFITLEVKSNYTLRCEANEPIVWRTSVKFESSNASYDTLNTDTPYGSMLYLRDITAEYVGYYYCVKQKVITEYVDYDVLVEDFNAAKIYIFVNDLDVLLVPMEVPVINAIQYDDVVIPCKPTMPDRVVELITPDQQVVSSSLTAKQLQSFPPEIAYTAIDYDPKVGFVIRRAINLTVTYLDCRGEFEGVKDTYQMYIVLDYNPTASHYCGHRLLLLQVYSSETTGRYDPKRGFVVQIQQITEGGLYTCRPQQPSPLNEAEEVTFFIVYSGNESNDRELAPICDVFPINRNNRNNNINCTVLASEIPLNNNNTLSSLSPVNNTHFSSKPNNNYTFYTVPDIMNVVDVVTMVVASRKSRSSSSSSLTTETSIGIGSSSADSDDGHDSDDDDDDDGEEDEHDDDRDDSGGGDDSREDINDDDNNNRGVGVRLGVGGGLSLSSRVFELTTESGYGIRMGKRDTTNSHRGKSYRMNGSTPRSRTTHVKKPEIYSQSHGHAVEGEQFNLTCTVEIRHAVRFIISWETPLDKDPESKARLFASNTLIDRTTDSHTIGQSVLTVSNAQRGDGGNYKCYVRDHSDNSAHNTYLMTILKNGESYINISEPNNYYTIKTNASKLVQINVKYRGYPTPSLNWYAPDGKLIQPTRKYDITRTNASITLKVNELELTDTGVYILRANNGVDEKELKFNVYVKDKPQVSVEDVYVQAGEQVRLLCKTIAYPAAIVSWTFTPCNITPKWPTCEERQFGFNSTRNTAQGESEIERIHELIFKPDKPGIAKCSAFNIMGGRTGRGMVLMGDITDNMTVYGVDENQKIAKGDEVIMTCAALVYYYSADLDWFKDGRMIENGNGVEVKTTFSDYSYKKAIKFKNIEDDNAGSYECRARKVDSDSEYDSKFLGIVVHEPAAPVMSQTNLGDKLKRALGESLELICKSTGIPKAGVTWYKDDVKINSENNILIEEDNSVLRIPFLKPADEGLYKCVASNRLGVTQASSQVNITNMPGALSLGWIFGIVIIIAILIIFIIYLCLRVLKERETLRQMKLAGLANFEDGAIEQINPAMSLDEQADLLPYDRRFEFPRDKLKLGKKLGAGAFGVVLKGYAEGLVPEEKETVVAVKMVKRTADNEVIKALVSELKIMVHLGQHLNVVNLLGAVTKDIVKREVMVIVEYCRHGNVQNFLLRNRKRFINQINPISDKIDPTITEQRFSAGDFEINRNSENDPRSGTRAGRPNSSGYLRQSDLYEGNVDSCATEQTVMTTIPEGEDNVLSNNSVQPAWRSNYKPDSTEAMSVTTSDLVSWAFQVARGMDYLSSRKVLHGDLAARNILLCEDNVVKICDFGLARSMYKNENYKKQGEAPLPIKWLALESLSDQVFSTYTDVWSFGIVLWEFFSLAKVPYPGMDANQSLYLKLKDGYRMEKPPYANEELYDIMLQCWSANPESRPLFHELEKKFARLLGDEVTNHYVDLNEPYLKMNTEYLTRKETDYLALMGSPDEIAPPPPRYVNGMILPEIRIDPSDDYLQMSPKTGSAIFSPRPKDDYVKADNFTFSEQHSPTISNNLDSPVMKNRKKIGVPPEEIPMLKKSADGVSRGGSQSDSDTEQSPGPQTTGRTFAQISRAPAEAETSLTRTDDNYVNVKAGDLSKKFMNSNGTKDAFSNPSYLMLKTVNEGR